MLCKCYYNLTENNDDTVNKNVLFLNKWNISCKLDDNLYLMAKSDGYRYIYSPLYIHTFKFIKRKREYRDIEFMQHKYNELSTVADKLKYYRYLYNISQDEVADYIGISRCAYLKYEKGLSRYPFKTMLRLAERYEVDIDDLFDDYHKFIYFKQERFIKGLRKKLNLKQHGFADILEVSPSMIKRYEEGRTYMSREKYNKLMDYCNSILYKRYILK